MVSWIEFSKKEFQMNKSRTPLYAVHLLNDFSGSPRVLADALECLDGGEFDVCVLTSKHKGFLTDKTVKKITIPYIKVTQRLGVLICFLLAQFCLFFVLLLRLLRDRMYKKHPVVLVNTLLPFGACLAARLLKADCVVYVHETSLSPLLFKRALRLVVELCASDVVFVSKYLARVEAFNNPNATVIYNGLRRDLSFSQKYDSKFRFANRNVLFCGSLKVYKGIYQFVELAKRLPSFNFVAALNCDPREISEIKIPKNIQIFVRPMHLASLYEQAFLVVNLSDPDSWVETFGLSILEGMASGAPVIAPPIGGPTELVSEQAGFLISPKDLDEIQSVVEELASDYELWCQFSAGSATQSKKFSADVFNKNINDFFSGFLQR